MASSSSNFSTAAKILFNSAQKVGAVGRVDKKISAFSKRQPFVPRAQNSAKGSLSSVSLRVSSFLEERKRVSRKSLDLVKFTIDLSGKGNGHQEESIVSKLDKAPLYSKKKDLDDGRTNADVKSDLSLTEVPKRKKDFIRNDITQLDEVVTMNRVRGVEVSEKATQLKNSFPSNHPFATEEKLSSPVVPYAEIITEDKPIFSSYQEKESKPFRSVMVATRSVPLAKEELYTDRGLPTKISCVGNEISDFKKSLRSSLENSDDGLLLSVDSWEKQREKELEKVEELRKAEKEQMEGFARVQQHETLGKEWVKKRSRVFSPTATKVSTALESISRGRTAESLDKLEQLIAEGYSELHISSAVSFICRKLSKESVADRAELKKRLLSIVEGKQKELSKTFEKLSLRFCPSGEFLDKFRSLSESARSTLDMKLKKRVVRQLVSHGFWEEGISFVQSQQSSSAAKYGLTLTLLYASLSLQPEAKAAFLGALHVLEDGKRLNGIECKLLLAQLEKGFSRKSLLTHATMLPDADERVYSALLYVSSPKEQFELLSEMSKKGLNPDDLLVKRAILCKKLFSNDSMGLFDEIEEQKRKIGLRPFHLSIAMKAAKKYDSEEVLEKTLDIMKEMDPERSLWSLKKILPILFDHSMMSHIVTICDHFNSSVPLKTVLPKGVAFYNQALIEVGRTPISSITPVDIHYSKKVSQNLSRDDKMEAVTSISSYTDSMLEYARDKNWEKAVHVVRNLPAHNEENAGVSTLLFNCALSAAMDRQDVAMDVYAVMRDKGFSPNVTTINTILSSLSKADMVDEAVKLMREASANCKDYNTYMIYMGLLARTNKLSEMVFSFEEAKNNIPNLPSSIFALALGLTVKESWEASYSIFSDLIRIHGKNINETVKEQVFNCLERNERFDELAALKKLLVSKRKKR